MTGRGEGGDERGLATDLPLKGESFLLPKQLDLVVVVVVAVAVAVVVVVCAIPSTHLAVEHRCIGSERVVDAVAFLADALVFE